MLVIRGVQEDLIMARAIYKNKFWFGAMAGQGNGTGAVLGLNLNDKWSLGYSISATNSSNRGFEIANQSLMLRFQLPGK